MRFEKLRFTTLLERMKDNLTETFKIIDRISNLGTLLQYSSLNSKSTVKNISKT